MTNSFFLPLTPDEATKALRELNLERFDLQVIPIPADGGCVVAVVEAPPAHRRMPGLDKLRRFKQRAALQQLASLSQRLVAAPHVPVLSQSQVLPQSQLQ